MLVRIETRDLDWPFQWKHVYTLVWMEAWAGGNPWKKPWSWAHWRLPSMLLTYLPRYPGTDVGSM
uniref:Unclassified n=1 Tax=Fusarium clavum TaxID=2594811 RepID=W1ID53_9HYPO|nr:unclassified [Fusarium clavum]CEF82675.1 unclassified [Fusarium clavum]